MGYKNIQFGAINTVDLDLNDTNTLDLSLDPVDVTQFKKTCGTNQTFIIANEIPKVIKLILTGGTLATNPFVHATKSVSLVMESGLLADYNGASVNRLYICVEEVENSIKLTGVINVE